MATKTEKKTGGLMDRSHWPFGMRNYIMLAVALAVTIAGFLFLGSGDITMAPILLVIGYCVLMPIAIFIRDKKADPEGVDEFEAQS